MNREELHSWAQKDVCEVCGSEYDVDYYVVDGREDAATLCDACFGELDGEPLVSDDSRSYGPRR